MEDPAFHDWYIDGFKLERSAAVLFVHFYEKKREIHFSGVTRCLINSFMFQNVIYQMSITSWDCSRELFLEAKKSLDETYPVLDGRNGSKIMSILPSVGAHILIEFSELSIVDLT
jgi:hypothetical protein